MFNYKTLDNTSMEIIHKAFIDAFSDYQVKIEMPIWKFEQMLLRRGYVPEMSIGAFVNETLIGFVLNGCRIWNGKLTVYDIGTGVVREHRRQGVINNILSDIKVLIKEKNVKKYVLEVIKSNESAVNLYKRQNFEIQRELECFQINKNQYNFINNHKIEQVNKIDLNELARFWDFNPSWQNSIDSVNAISDSFLYSTVRFDDTIVGYGIIDKKTGDIPQIAVDRNFRCNGIATSIITNLIKNTESPNISVLNIDGQMKSMQNFFIKLGFKNSVTQYEMVLCL